jgi:tetratricopeptide (TPR) repeat protein
MVIEKYLNKNIIVLILMSIAIFISPLVAPTIFAKAGSYADFYKAWFFQVSLPAIFGIWAIINIFYKNNSFKLHLSSIHIWIMSLLLISSLSMIWAYHKNLGIIDLSRWLAAGILCLFLIQLISCLDPKQSKVIILTAILGSATVVTIVGILQYFNKFDFYLQAVAPAAGFGNRNVAMHFIMLCLPLFAFMFVVTNKKYFIIPLGILICCMFVYIQCSNNRTVMFGTALEVLAFCCWFYYFKKKNNTAFRGFSRLKITTALVSIIAAIFIGCLTPEFKLKRWAEISPVQKVTSRTGSIIERKRLILNTLHMIKENFWLGVGFGNWSLYYPKYAGKYHLSECMSTEYPDARVLYKRTHNEWLQTFAEIGFIGFFCFIMIILSVFYMILRIVSTYPKTEEAIFAASICTALIGVSTNMSASFPLRVSIPCIVIFSYIALVYNDYIRLPQASDINAKSFREKWQHILLGKERKITVNIPNTLGKSCLVLFAAGCLSLSPYVYNSYDKWIGAHHCRNMAAMAMEQERIDLAIGFIEKSLEINPADPDNLYYSLGNLYLHKKQYEKAINAYKYSIEHILPYTPFTHQMLASTYVQLGMLQHAVSTLKKAINDMPKQGGYYYVLGDALARMQDLPGALECYKNALKYAPNHPWAQAAKDVIAANIK